MKTNKQLTIIIASGKSYQKNVYGNQIRAVSSDLLQTVSPFVTRNKLLYLLFSVF